MRIIITGGTGLIGKALSSHLIKQQHEVTVLSRNPRTARGVPFGVQVEEWDAKTAQGWGKLAEGADAIVNLAGAGIADQRWSERRKRLILESRIHAGQAVVEAVKAAQNPPKVVIQASAVGYYGGNRGDVPLTEESGPGGDFLAQVCFDWEQSSAEIDDMGIRRPVIRTGIVLSNKGGAWPKIKLPFHFFAGGPLGSGTQWYPWIHIDDEVRAIQFLIEHATATGPYNLCAPEPLPNKELARVIGRVMERPAFLPAPGFAMKAVLGEMSTILLDGQHTIPQRLTAAGFTFTYPTAAEAIEALVHPPVAATAAPVQHAA
ncbi:MAG: TIGR01777 family protein [Caldilineaceae bacterium]|nr:TIGR01777 family protein [Caldilineaceae bacterium]